MASIIRMLMLAQAKAEFWITNPGLQADITLDSDSSWHLGGFCLGMASEGEAARLTASFDWHGSQPLPAEPSNGAAGAYLVWFDGRQDYWGAAQASWDTSSCSEKLQTATGYKHLYLHSKFAISVKQRTASRDWHFALVTCGAMEGAPMTLKLEVEHGARSTFAANSNFDESSCPVMPVDWWQEARSEPAFWAILLLVVFLSCAGALVVPLIIYCRKLKKQNKSLKRTSNSNEELSNEVVIGKPCDLPENAMVAEGHLNVESKVPV